MTKFCLIRHGQTDWNLEGRYQGQSNVSLNQTGREQAHSVAQKINKHKFELIYTSDLDRAKETSGIIAAELNIPIEVDPRLREINQGEWEGKHVDVIKNLFSEMWKLRTVSASNIRPPGGETVEEVGARVYAALNDIAAQYPNGQIIIVSHGLALATVICKVKNCQ